MTRLLELIKQRRERRNHKERRASVERIHTSNELFREESWKEKTSFFFSCYFSIDSLRSLRRRRRINQSITLSWLWLIQEEFPQHNLSSHPIKPPYQAHLPSPPIKPLYQAHLSSSPIKLIYQAHLSSPSTKPTYQAPVASDRSKRS